MRTHKHKCVSPFHEGPRIREHYNETCTLPFEDSCIPCQDEELAAAGATWQYHDDYPTSDVDPGL